MVCAGVWFCDLGRKGSGLPALSCPFRRHSHVPTGALPPFMRQNMSPLGSWHLLVILLSGLLPCLVPSFHLDICFRIKSVPKRLLLTALRKRAQLDPVLRSHFILFLTLNTMGNYFISVFVCVFIPLTGLWAPQGRDYLCFYSQQSPGLNQCLAEEWEETEVCWENKWRGRFQRKMPKWLYQ